RSADGAPHGLGGRTTGDAPSLRRSVPPYRVTERSDGASRWQAPPPTPPSWAPREGLTCPSSTERRGKAGRLLSPPTESSSPDRGQDDRPHGGPRTQGTRSS